MAKKHSELQDPNLHDLKGFSAASNSTAPTKNSAGTYVWAPISSLGGTGPTGPTGPAGASLGTKYTNVRVATTANGTITTAFENGDTVDGVTLATGDRILLKNQTTGSQNGIYTVNASGSPTRASGMSAATTVIPGNFVWVNEGTANKQRRFQITNSGTIGVDSITWALYEDFQTPPPLDLTKDVSVTSAQTNLVPKNLIGAGASTSLIVNFANGNTHLIDLQDFSGNVTLTLSNPKDGAVYTLIIIQGSSARTITWPSTVEFPGDVAPTLTTTNNKADMIVMLYSSVIGKYFATYTQNLSTT